MSEVEQKERKRWGGVVSHRTEEYMAISLEIPKRIGVRLDTLATQVNPPISRAEVIRRLLEAALNNPIAHLIVRGSHIWCAVCGEYFLACSMCSGPVCRCDSPCHNPDDE